MTRWYPLPEGVDHGADLFAPDVTDLVVQFARLTPSTTRAIADATARAGGVRGLLRRMRLEPSPSRSRWPGSVLPPPGRAHVAAGGSSGGTRHAKYVDTNDNANVSIALTLVMASVAVR